MPLPAPWGPRGFERLDTAPPDEPADVLLTLSRAVERFAGWHGVAVLEPPPSPGPAVGVSRQNSVTAVTFPLMALYSGLWVRGIRLMSLPMLPVTLSRPCMKAAVSSSSPFWILTESS